MPYIKKEKLFDAVARTLKGYANASEIGAALGKSYQTARARLDKPEDLTLGELRMLSMRLHIPKEEIMNVIKW